MLFRSSFFLLIRCAGYLFNIEKYRANVRMCVCEYERILMWIDLVGREKNDTQFNTELI